MPAANFENTHKFIEQEINKCLPLIGRKSERTDKFLKAKVIALVHALEGINEFGDDLPAYGKHVRRMYGAQKASADGLHEVLVHLGVRHQHAGKTYTGASRPASSKPAKNKSAKKSPEKKKSSSSAGGKKSTKKKKTSRKKVA